MDSNVNKILQNIVNTATLAADEAKAACPTSRRTYSATLAACCSSCIRVPLKIR